jgi:hypothetical protein
MDDQEVGEMQAENGALNASSRNQDLIPSLLLLIAMAFVLR